MDGPMPVADAEEVLEYLTRVMREGERDSMKAAELLGKHYGLMTEHETVSAVPVIVDDVPPGGEVGQG